MEMSEEIEEVPEEGQTAEEMLNEALLLIERSVEHLLSLMGETDDSILTDWLVVAVSQGFMEDGRPAASDAMILPKRFLPGYRIKGLLVDALDQLRASDQQIIVMNQGDGEEDV